MNLRKAVCPFSVQGLNYQYRQPGHSTMRYEAWSKLENILDKMRLNAAVPAALQKACSDFLHCCAAVQKDLQKDLPALMHTCANRWGILLAHANIGKKILKDHDALERAKTILDGLCVAYKSWKPSPAPIEAAQSQQQAVPESSTQVNAQFCDAGSVIC